MKSLNKIHQRLIMLFLNISLLLFLLLTTLTMRASDREYTNVAYNTSINPLNDSILLKYNHQLVAESNFEIEVEDNYFLIDAPIVLSPKPALMSNYANSSKVSGTLPSRIINYQKHSFPGNLHNNSIFKDHYNKYLAPSIRFKLFK